MAPKPNLDAIDLEMLIQSSIQTLCDQMLNTEMEYIDQLTQTRIFGDRILASVNLIGNFMGVLAIQVSDALAVDVTSHMYNMPPSEITDLDEVMDVVGEISNIVGGHLKSFLNDHGLECTLSPPAVTTGRDYKTDTPGMRRHEFFSFFLGDETMIVEVGLKPADLMEEDMANAMKNTDDIEFEKLNAFDIETCVDKALTQVFDVMIGLPISQTDCRGPVGEDFHHINGSIGISGNLKGRVNVITTLEFGQLMTAQMVGAEPEDVIGTDELKDVIGEVCNIVSGTLRSALNDFGITCIISPPSFTTGEKFHVQMVQLPRIERFCYEHAGHLLCVEVGIEK